MTRKAADCISLEQLSLAPLMFLDNGTSFLKINRVREAKDICEFLSFVDNFIIKPFVTVGCDQSFRKRDPFCSEFSNPFD